jgi:hypothetical protein
MVLAFTAQLAQDFLLLQVGAARMILVSPVLISAHLNDKFGQDGCTRTVDGNVVFSLIASSQCVLNRVL